MKIHLIRLAVVMALLLVVAGCRGVEPVPTTQPSSPTLTRWEYRQLSMGVAVRMVLYATDEDTAFNAAKAAYARVAAVNEAASDYKIDSELMRLCKQAGQGPVKVGDELVTRLILRNARAMEFVHLKDLRGSGTEPVQVLSGYHWQDGLGYYEVTRDSASHFFIDALPAGTHVFETSVRAQHAGIYQTGVAEINCMYAPGFSAHSASVRLEVVP